jgi:hypothetical protein
MLEQSMLRRVQRVFKRNTPAEYHSRSITETHETISNIIILLWK